MIRIASPSSFPVPPWHEVFLRMLPAIRLYARLSFRHLRAEQREECIEEAVCNACTAIARLAERNKLDLAYPSVLARFAVAQVKDGRHVGGHLNCHDVLSPYCQRRKKIAVERLDHFDEEGNQWKEAVVVDTRLAPVPDIVAFRCDFSQWLKSFPRRNRKIALKLATNESTDCVARMFKVSAGRISQLRKELKAAWEEFHGETKPSEAVAVPA